MAIRCGSARCGLTLQGRVGVFGGAFDPPHLAHLEVAVQALRQFRLAGVVFVPNGVPPQRGAPPVASKEDRLRMLEALTDGQPKLSVSRIELDREGPSYTIDTIRAMGEDCPLGLCFILGADRLATIASWRESEALVRLVPFIVAPRPGVSLASLRGPLVEKATIHVLAMTEVDLSSTFVREAAAEGRPVDAWVPPGVAAYINVRGLYRKGEAR